MEEHETEIAYWAGRLIGYDQAWEVAEEIVETIKKAQNQALRIHDVVGRSEQLCDCTDPCEETLAMRCTGCGNLTECD